MAMWEYMNGYGWGGMGLGMIGMSLFWILLIVVIVIFLKSKGDSGVSSGQRQEKSALDILKERYARSEIGREEFEQKKRDLE
jgi:putative membrane protein